MNIKRFNKSEIENANLYVDAVYEGGRSGNAGDDPLHPMLGVSNQGGFRYLGSLNNPKLIVLTSSFADADWPDNINLETGLFTYYGDNKRPGRDIHDTPRHGNELLRNMFNLKHSWPLGCKEIPPILIFRNAGAYRDMVFVGLAVPGAKELSSAEDLVAIWKISKGQRFQNYRAIFTVLDVMCISRKWLEDVRAGNVNSGNCPDEWKNWVGSGVSKPLKAERSVEHRTKEEQLPNDKVSLKKINLIHNYFIEYPIKFEKCAAAIVQLMDKNFISLDITRPTKDGGRDAIGLFRVGVGSSSILIDFALEAKCYDTKNSVGVREVSRLISRLRHRQFGILVTTSYLHSQAYREIKEDRHPVIVISAVDILDILARSGINSAMDIAHWLKSNFPNE